MNKLLVLLGIIALILSSCHGSKKMVKSPKTDVVKASTIVKPSVYEYAKPLPNWMTAELDIDFQSEAFSQDFTAKIRIKKDDTAWLSLTGLFGIEGARILVTRDTFEVIDRINKRYIKEHISLANKFSPIDINLKTLQYLVLGCMAENIDTTYEKVISKGDTVHYSKGNANQTKLCSFVGCNNFYQFEKYMSAQLNMEANLMDFNQKFNTGFPVPIHRHYLVKKDGKEVKLKIKLSELQMDHPVEFNFVVGKNYERVRL
ncbi:MAG: DUF4292 domain-containing protein [Chitinophagales bacterium]|nr:DUF4292 domain-containing protein [Chitinophagales bacterium]